MDPRNLARHGSKLTTRLTSMPEKPLKRPDKLPKALG